MGNVVIRSYGKDQLQKSQKDTVFQKGDLVTRMLYIYSKATIVSELSCLKAFIIFKTNGIAWPCTPVR